MTTGVTNPKEALVTEVHNQREHLQLRVRETQQLIDQSQAEVKRLQQKSVDITTQLNRLEANFDTVPRNDIKVIYTNALDTRTRLLTMQGQLEQRRNDLTQLESFVKTLDHLTEMVQGVPAASVVGISSGGTNGSVVVNGGLSDITIIRIIESQEAERQRLARQMHDGPAQSLTNFILQAEICQRLFDRNPARATEELANLKVAASTTFQKVRDFIFDLRPMMLDDLGLAPTVRRYVDAFAEKSNIETRLNIVGEERRRMESHTEVMMFRSVQELLSYARDTSGSTKCEIVLDISGAPIKATVSFNGKSLDETETPPDQAQTKVVGLASLRERVELVGGNLDSYSGDGENNRVDVVMPTSESA